jgi:hypothetical protein
MENPETMIVELTGDDLASINLYAERFRLNKIRHHVASKKINPNLSEYEAQRVGIVGEWAIKKATGGDLDLKIYDGPDTGIDIVIGVHECHIKTYTHKAPNILFFVNDMESFTANVGIGCQILGERSVRIMGCISRAKFERDMFHRDLGYGDRLCVRQSSLSPLSVLLPKHDHAVFWEQYDYAERVDRMKRLYRDPPPGAAFCARCEGGGCTKCDFFGYIKDEEKR